MVGGYRAGCPQVEAEESAAPAPCPQRAITLLTRDFPGRPGASVAGGGGFPYLAAVRRPGARPGGVGAIFGQPSSLRLLRCPKLRRRGGRTSGPSQQGRPHQEQRGPGRERPPRTRRALVARELGHFGLDGKAMPPPMMTADQPYDSVR